MHLSCPDFAAISHIRHGFFTREGGVSSGIYASLNCGPGSGDDLKNVMENRAQAMQSIGYLSESLVTCYQIHSAHAITVTKTWDIQDSPQADAMVTKTPGIALGILTADCLPILCADPKAKIIGAIHAGWKGAFDGIIESTIEAMRKLGADPAEIHAAIGPGIGQESYEVGPEFFARFMQQDIENQRFFTDSPRTGHHRFDLKSYACHRLYRAGLTHINSLAHDTCLDENRFFSYRRSCLRSERAYGRQLSVIMLLP